MPYLGVRPADITSATEAEIAGDLTVDTSTLVVDAANNRVGVGTASPAFSSGSGLEIEKSDTATLRVERTGSTASAGEFFAGNDKVVIGSTSNTHLQFRTNGSEVGRFLAGGGLTFNGDTAAVNALDDYEEGTWTPTADSNITFTGSPSGNYIKVGSLVTVFESLTCNLTNGQEFIIGGLPFAPAAANEPVVLILNNSSTFVYVPRGRTDTSSQIKGRSPATVNGINLMIQATYRV
tara:strand:- start:388 stop:1095 length:708 start_codon:yes stop_codon:yes gene_type:complete